jgi:hypothetical protein
MSKKKRIVPFSWWPANWGLEGERKELAEAEYYFEGEALERKKIKIRKPEGRDRDLDLLVLDEQYERISPEDALYRKLELGHEDHDSSEYQQSRLELDISTGRKTRDEAHKAIADLRKEPWFAILRGEHKSNGDGSQLTFELDWNDHFVEGLVQNGWSGRTDDEIVDAWFSSTCRELMAGPEEEPVDISPLGTGFSRTRKARNEDGRSEFF